MGSLTKERLCNALKERGVKEVIIEIDSNEVASIEISGDNFKIKMTNDDFSEQGL